MSSTAGLDGGEGTPAAGQAAGGAADEKTSDRGWAPAATATRLVLVRHGETDHTTERRFSGGLASANPGLNETGRAQVRATAEWLATMAGHIDVLLASPVRRTLESAEILAEAIGRAVEVEKGFAEMEFGSWDGMTFAEVAERHQEDLTAWFDSMEAAPHGGESFLEVQTRVLEALQQTLAAYEGKTVAVVSHVTPIKTLVAEALAVPLATVYRMELSPASVTVLTFYSDTPEGEQPWASMRLFNALPGDPQLVPPGR